MTRAELRHPERFPQQRRKYLGEMADKKHLKAYLKGKSQFRDGGFFFKDQFFPNYRQVKFQKQTV